MVFVLVTCFLKIATKEFLLLFGLVWTGTRERSRLLVRQTQVMWKWKVILTEVSILWSTIWRKATPNCKCAKTLSVWASGWYRTCWRRPRMAWFQYRMPQMSCCIQNLSEKIVRRFLNDIPNLPLHITVVQVRQSCTWSHFRSLADVYKLFKEKHYIHTYIHT